MPRKTKEQTEKEELKKEKSTAKKATTKKTSTKKTAAKKTTVTKKATTAKKATTTKKDSSTKKAATKKADSAVKGTKASTAKKTASTKKAATKKADSAIKETKASTAKKTASTKKATTKKVDSTVKKAKASTAKKATSTKKTTAKKATKKASAKVQAIPVVEYYDLPYRYNQTIVKLLAQTPTTLFVYWDISDEDRENYIKTYGDNFFEETKPVLIVRNNTMNYSFEVEINDFANSWYLHVNDSKCNYSIELGRRPISIEAKNKIETDYIYVTTSNVIESPNDRILFNIDEQKVYYRNVKNNVTTTRKISFINSMGKIYNIYELYDALYKDEDFTTHMPTSSTSWFK